MQVHTTHSCYQNSSVNMQINKTSLVQSRDSRKEATIARTLWFSSLLTLQCSNFSPSLFLNKQMTNGKLHLLQNKRHQQMRPISIAWLMHALNSQAVHSQREEALMGRRDPYLCQNIVQETKGTTLFHCYCVRLLLSTHTHTSTCQRKEHFPLPLPTQLHVLRASILVKT